jgi:hypothetical protein
MRRIASHPMSEEQRRLLELLDSAGNGCTANVLVALGFETDLVVGVVAAGLAVSETEPELVDGHAVDVTRVRITDAGRRALAEGTQ